jgi:hypothetical protein
MPLCKQTQCFTGFVLKLNLKQKWIIDLTPAAFSSSDDFLKPQIRAHSETTVAVRGIHVTLTCTAVSSSDSPMATVWRKDCEILCDVDV